jgi:uronate dehydrogenase
MKRVLMTGAAGGIGTMLTPLLRGLYPELLLSDLRTPKALAPGDKFAAANLENIDEVEKICEGVDGILHFGGYSVEGTWDQIHSANIVGCYNLFEAARAAKVERIVFASSNHAVGFYPRQRRIGMDDAVRPDSRYGASKAFGEALAALYAYKHGMRVTCLRIGHVLDTPADKRRLSIWLSPPDLVQLIRIGLEHPDIRHEIFFGASDNDRGFWDNEPAFRYGYRPQSRAEDHAAAALAADARLPPDPVGDWYEGGPFCSDEFDNGIAKSPI